MEPIVFSKLLSYRCLYAEAHDSLDDLLASLPSAGAIEMAAYLLLRKETLKRDENDFSLLAPWMFKMDHDLRDRMLEFLQQVNIGEYSFMDRMALHMLIDRLLEAHNDLKGSLADSELWVTNFVKAYLMCCDLRLNYGVKEVEGLSDEERVRAYLPERMKYDDLEFVKDFRLEMLKLCCFCQFLEGDDKRKGWLDCFVNARGLKGWDRYPLFLVDFYTSFLQNKEGPTCVFELVDEDYYAFPLICNMTVDTAGYKATADCKGMRAKPVYHLDGKRFVVLSPNFFVDKFFQSFLFDFAQVLACHAEDTGIANYPQLKRWMGETFTERHFFYDIMNGCFPRYRRWSGCALKERLGDGEPDFYMRKGNRIFLFEFKDVMLDADTKHSGSYDRIAREVKELLVLSTWDKAKGKMKRKPQRKGASQLLHTIVHGLPDLVCGVDRVESPGGFTVYPIIVFTDRNLGFEGVNRMVAECFEEMKAQTVIAPQFDVKPLVMMNLEELVLLEDYFLRGQLVLEDLLDVYITMDASIPFDKVLMRTAFKRGYHAERTARFQKLLDDLAGHR